MLFVSESPGTHRWSRADLAHTDAQHTSGMLPFSLQVYKFVLIMHSTNVYIFPLTGVDAAGWCHRGGVPTLLNVSP